MVITIIIVSLEGNFQIILEPHKILQHDESQSIGNCLDNKIEQEPIQNKKIQNT